MPETDIAEDQESEIQIQCNKTVRHGFGDISEDMRKELIQGYYSYFADKRHDTQGRPLEGDSLSGGDWRVTDRQRTVNAALVLCLNLGVDPPDVIKIQPSARVEAWVDPKQFVDSKKALEQIGKNLQNQYETLGARTKYKQSLDPNIDDIKRFCVSLRRAARDDRVLFHYNGHGVPKPTSSGEIWVFNRGYTQYIPLSVYELQACLGPSVIYCYDCSGAGNIINSFNEIVAKQNQFAKETNEVQPDFSSSIQLGACRADEILPMNPNLPADLFTACITTPVDMAVKWFLLQNQEIAASLGLDANNVVIPGKISDRRTPLGELNWIFTAITDTIAWSTLKPEIFKRLFRQDLIVAAMFRNFLLATRIMRAHNCHPVSSPEIPDTFDHPLWDSWDATVNHCLLQITSDTPPVDGCLFSDFFEQQLIAFEMWLVYESGDDNKHPEQLSILLQVLLSQIHRLRALTLLCRYLDLGPSAVRTALNMGFFIYVLKLLQSPAPELRPVLVFIWARIMAVDRSVQTELVKENGYMYFVNILLDPHSQSNSVGNPSDPAICCFVLAQFAYGYPTARKMLSVIDPLIKTLEKFLDSESPLLRLWSIMLLAELTIPRSLSLLLWRLRDPIPEVRAATLYATTSYVLSGSPAEVDMIGKVMVTVALDGSPIVRYEFIVSMSDYILENESKFLVCAFTTLEEEYMTTCQGGDMRSESPAHGTACLALWRTLLVLCDDAMPHIKQAARKIVDYVNMMLMKSPIAEGVYDMISALITRNSSSNGYLTECLESVMSSRVNTPEGSLFGIPLQTFDSPNDDSSQYGRSAGTLLSQFNYGNYDSRGQSLRAQTPSGRSLSGGTPVGTPSTSNLMNELRKNSTMSDATEVDSMNGNESVRTGLQNLSVNAPNDSTSSPNDATNGSMNGSTDASTAGPNGNAGPNGTNGNTGTSSMTAHAALLKAQKQSNEETAHHSDTPIGSLLKSAVKWIVGDDFTPANVQMKINGRSKHRVPLSQEAPAPSIAQLHPNASSQTSVDPDSTNPRSQSNSGIVIESDFREYCVDFFREPQLKPSENDEEGSSVYLEKQWRKARNESLIEETQAQKVMAVSGSWGNHVSSLMAIGDAPQKLLFSQYERHLLASDHSNVAVFDWQKGRLLNRFSGGSNIADIKFINEDDTPLVLTASRDGNARIFKNYSDPTCTQIVTSWFMFADLVHQNPQNADVIVDWQQSRGHLLVGGDARVIRVWDAAREQAIYDMPVRTGQQLVALNSDQVAGNIVLGGFTDGAIQVFDRRLDKRNCMVHRWEPTPRGSTKLGHNSRIVNLRMQRGGTREVVSGSSNGQVCLWDIRESQPVGGFKAHTRDMTCLDVHEHAPVIATASRVLGIWSTEGRRISTLKGLSSNYLSPKSASIGALAFHPHQMVVALSTVDEPTMSVYRCLA